LLSLAAAGTGYSEGAANEQFPWMASFPVGLSCGRCVEGVLDSYEPVACDQVVIDVEDEGSLYERCNWQTAP